MKSITVKAPAKVNYRLDVLAKRPDGYHELRMIMQPLDLCDEITVRLGGTPGIIVRCARVGVPEGEANIAWKAAAEILRETGAQVGVEITIVKNIPAAAGLGGGSSDAASVLLGMNRLLEAGIETSRLMEIGVKLGADVPFFLLEQPALAEGIGERLTPVSTPPLWIVLVNPGVPVSTAWVYGNFKLTGRSAEISMLPFLADVDKVASILHNDLESVTIPAFPVVGEIREQLLAAGAHGSLMSGSGPTVFGVFSDAAQAEKAAAGLRRDGWFTAAVRTLHPER